VAAATGGPDHRLPPVGLTLPVPGPRTRAEKPYGTVTPPSYPWNRKAAPVASVPIKEEKQAYRAGP
jgi:hypothetical protein